ncbi:MAG TPA: hypothetical protein VIJ23_19320 [Mycobacterium sp.]
MHAVGLAELLALLAAVAMIGGAFGFFGAVVLLRRRRRTRRTFALGFLCGVATAAVYDVRRRGVTALVTMVRRRVLPSRTSLRRAHLSLRDAVLVSSAGK